MARAAGYMNGQTPIIDSGRLAGLGYSQREAANALGCSRTSLSNWENAKSGVPRYIGLACAALGMTGYGDNCVEDEKDE
jgi:hypothetical protein